MMTKTNTMAKTSTIASTMERPGQACRISTMLETITTDQGQVEAKTDPTAEDSFTGKENTAGNSEGQNKASTRTKGMKGSELSWEEAMVVIRRHRQEREE